jgi:hypothetical protein
MRRRPTAREQEQAAARRPAPGPRLESPALTPAGEALAMLRRRGVRTKPWPPDLPFTEDLDEVLQERFARLVDHYAFRLFLRGAIQRGKGFVPGAVTRYVGARAARRMAEGLVSLGLASPAGRGHYRLTRPPRSFGGILEWYVARELRLRLGFDTAFGLRFFAPGVGGDLDVVAAAEGRLVYLELKSSPPRQIGEAEVRAFLARRSALRPDLTLFAVDTALRLSDKVIPMLADAMAARGAGSEPPRRLVREVWALTPRLYAVNAKADLLGNVARAIAEGLHALAPPGP